MKLSKMFGIQALCFRGIALCAVTLIFAQALYAQVPLPDDKNIFQDDSKDAESKRKDDVKKSTKPAAKASQDFDFKAPQIEFLKDKNEIYGKGGVLISQGGLQVQADQAIVNMSTKEAELKDNVVMSAAGGDIRADSAKVNIDSETGSFTNSDFTFDEGGYTVFSHDTLKLSEFEFQLHDAEFTTCHCLDGDKPWKISASSCNITQEGYAHTYGSTVSFQGVPLLYTPWLVFPTKTKRSSGLLAPVYGISSQDGFEYHQPVFFSIDESTDFILTPFIETSSRVGSEFRFRDIFSTRSNIDTKMIYSDDSRRSGSLRGVDVTGLPDPTIKENRFGGFYNQIWRPDPDLDLPVEFLADGHYTNDSVFVREFDDPEIGTRDAQYLTSTAVVRGLLLDTVNAEISTEYNQAITTPQEYMLQRLPQIALSTSESFRPFGFNPYGIKFVTSGDILATQFQRTTGYDGSRIDFHPKVQMPFHFSNIVKGKVYGEVHHTEYRMDDTFNPDPNATVGNLDDSSSRTIPIFGGAIGTGVERVYELEKGNWLSNLVGTGAQNEGSELVRLKHTIEPMIQYAYVPDVDQDNNPFYDYLDRYTQRSLFTYGAASRLYGRMSTPLSRSRDIGEIAPSVEDLPTIDVGRALSDFGNNPDLSVPSIVRRSGEIRQLAEFSIKQAYDYTEDKENLNPLGSPFSDINTRLVLSPSTYFALLFGSNYNAEDHHMSSYEVGLGLHDDRDDLVRLRYTFTKDQISQLEANAELKLHERLSLGYYTRYDELGSEFIENTGLLRFNSACKCWKLDFGVSETTNPDEKQFLLTFTFAGLGDITQNVGVPQDDQNQ